MALFISGFRIAIIICCLLSFGIVYAQDADDEPIEKSDKKPLWEVGAFLSGFTIPHYVGSDEYYTYVFPFPYFIYRGEKFKADGGNVRGLFAESDRFELNISSGGNLPVSSKSNEARKGMPALDALLEIGPALRYYLFRHKNFDHLYLEAALRGAVSVEFSGVFNIGVDYRGYRYTLGLNYKNESLFKDIDLSLFASAGISYADSILNGYFYDVAPEFATREREAFDADDGYAGVYLSSSFLKKLSERWAFGGYAVWRNINGAVFEDSPLVRTSDNLYGGLSLIYKIGQSSVLVPLEK